MDHKVVVFEDAYCVNKEDIANYVHEVINPIVMQSFTNRITHMFLDNYKSTYNKKTSKK